MSITHRQTLGDLLRRTAARYPNKPGIVCGDTTWTYATFDAICNRLANGLAARGVKTGDRIAILSRNSHAFAAVRFAVAKLGAILVPVNFMMKAAEVAYVLRHAEASWLFVDTGLAAVGAEAAAMDTAVRTQCWLPGEHPTDPTPGLLRFEELLADDASEPEVALDNRMPLQIIYTSGTESLPKGAVLTHEAVLWEYVSCIIDLGFRADDVTLHALPLFHCAQLDAFLGPYVYLGATNVITAAPTPDNVLTLVSRHRVTSFFAPPTIWIGLLRAPALAGADTASLQRGYYGASIMPVPVLHEMQARLPNVQLWNVYGQTEIAPAAVCLQPADQLPRAGSAGLPMLNVETRVVDDAGKPVAPGEIGEVVHRSPQLMREYYQDTTRTDEAFAGGWFHSGDLARIDEDGYLTIVDRKKDMIKTGGENVASREVEEAIYKLDGVSEVAVIGLSDPVWIEKVTAVVVVKDGHALEAKDVIAHCRSILASFKVPKQVDFVEALPKNPSGKLLKRQLRKQYEEDTSR